MIVNDLNAFRSIRCPFEAEAILAIDADAVLSFAVTLQEFQMIIGWKTEVRQSDGRVQLIELPSRHIPQRCGTGMPSLPRVCTLEDVFRSCVRK